MASKVDQRVLWQTPGRQPNGLQASDEGLWVIDQIDPNVVFLLAYARKRRLASITAAERAAFAGRMRARVDNLEPEAFVHRPEAVFAVGSRG